MCTHWILLEESGHAVCANNKSDHYGHFIYGEHPVCSSVEFLQFDDAAYPDPERWP